MLGEVVGRQLGEREWKAVEGEGDTGLPLAPAPPPQPSAGRQVADGKRGHLGAGDSESPSSS